jgi:hypothetical protein
MYAYLVLDNLTCAWEFFCWENRVHTEQANTHMTFWPTLLTYNNPLQSVPLHHMVHADSSPSAPHFLRCPLLSYTPQSTAISAILIHQMARADSSPSAPHFLCCLLLCLHTTIHCNQCLFHPLYGTCSLIALHTPLFVLSPALVTHHNPP